MIKNRKIINYIFYICFLFLNMRVTYFLQNDISSYRLIHIIQNKTFKEEAFNDIEYCISKNLYETNMDMDIVKKLAIEKYGSSTIKDTSKYLNKTYIKQEKDNIGVIFFTETSEYVGYAESISDDYIFNDIIKGITTNRKNAKVINTWTIKFQDGTKGYMYFFMNRINGEMLYEINMECWSKKHYYSMEAVTLNNPDFLNKEISIILSTFKHKNFNSIQNTTIDSYDFLSSKRIANITNDFLNYEIKTFRELCEKPDEFDEFCNGLKYNLSSIQELSENVYDVEISVERYDIKKAAKQLINENNGNGVELTKVLSYAKDQKIYSNHKITLEINLLTGDIEPDIHYLESLFAQGIIIN